MRSFLKLHVDLFSFLCVHVYGWVGACAPLSGGQKTLCESGLSLYRVGPNDQTQVMGLSSQCIFPVNHFTGHQFNTGSVGAVETVKCLSMIATLPPLPSKGGSERSGI